VLREGLANVVRHAHASRVHITVSVSTGWVLARIFDNGVGPGLGTRAGGRGLGNLAHRAETLGGHMSLDAGPEGKGTVLTWQVPLTPPPATAV
jgi:signal transduction histidine kinase